VNYFMVDILCLACEIYYTYNVRNHGLNQWITLDTKYSISRTCHGFKLEEKEQKSFNWYSASMLPIHKFFFVQRFVYVKICAEEMQNTDNLLSVCLLFCLGAEKGNEIVDCIPGASPLRLLDLPAFILASNHCIFHRILDLISWIPKSQYLLLSSIYELESQDIECLKSELSIPVYTIGPAIPDLRLRDHSSAGNNNNELNYLRWLDYQPDCSVLNISFQTMM